MTIVPFWKTLTFWISLGVWFVALGGHYVGEIPAPYGIVAANVVALVYAVLRCLVKRKNGLPWKGILTTSEFAVTSATVFLNLLDSLAQVPAMPPKVLVGISAAAGFMATVLHHLSGTATLAIGIDPSAKISNEEIKKLLKMEKVDGDVTPTGTPKALASEAVTAVERPESLKKG